MNRDSSVLCERKTCMGESSTPTRHAPMADKGRPVDFQDRLPNKHQRIN